VRVKASEIAGVVGGTWEGGSDPELTGVAPLERAGPTDLSFLAHPRYQSYVDASRAAAILVTSALADRTPSHLPRIVVADVHRALADLLPRLYPPPVQKAGIHATAVVGRSVVIGEGVSVGPYAVIGDRTVIGNRARIGAHVVVGDDCDVGEDVVLHPHVTLYPRVALGARSILHTGVRAGVDGFGYAFTGTGHRKVPQVGRCVIGTDVEIGANTTIDRGSIGTTEIGNGVKIDNLVHIAHNVRIGDLSIIVAQVGIAGSTTIGKGVTLAGQAGVPGHTTIGDGATIAAQAGVFGDVPPGETWSGYPARPHREALRSQAGLARLPRILTRIRALERAVLGQEKREE
jgi:UDP-3-O-[3-hydroxymyristoyl] glucosamine N-acyltransferase